MIRFSLLFCLAIISSLSWGMHVPNAEVCKAEKINNSTQKYTYDDTLNLRCSAEQISKSQKWHIQNGAFLAFVSDFLATKRTPASAPVGRKGSPLQNTSYQPTRNADEIVNGRRYTGHALDQAQNRGLTPSVIEDAIKNGRRSPDPIAGRTRNYSPDNNLTVITEGKDVITVIPGKR